MPISGKSKWTNSKVAKLLGIRYPIIQGPFGRGGSTPLLVATVSNSGGLGSYGANDLSPDAITKVAAEIRALTDKPFNLNLWVSTFDQGGDSLDPSTVEEAILLEEAGVDIVVAAGFEGGGHRPSFLQRAEDSLIGTFALVPQIADKIKTPVVAAGGVADGRGIAAALILRADAVQIGTAFLACDESGASDQHRQLLFSEASRETDLSKIYTGRFARGLRNKISLQFKDLEKNFAPYPAQNWMIAPLRAAALAQNRLDLVGLWSGQAAPLIRYQRAAELFEALVVETEDIFKI